MSNKLKYLLTILLSIIFVLPQPAFASSPQSHYTQSQQFNLTTINPKLTLPEAIEQYPEILNIFCITPLSDEEVKRMASDGIRVFDVDKDMSAVSILSSLNARVFHNKPPLSKNSSYHPTLFASSSYGAAWPYIEKNGSVPNCYGYALGISSECHPGSFSGREYYQQPVETIRDNVKADMAQSFNGGGRSIDSNISTISSWEWRVAMRTGEGIINLGPLGAYYTWDYHFWLQTNTGTWCHKPATNPSVHLGNVTPHTASWDLKIRGYEPIPNFYNSNTLYLALYTAN